MHMVIRAIVYAPTREEGLSKAKSIFENMCGEGRVFDYFTSFDDDSSPVSGPKRWGKLPVIAEADSKEGKKLINQAMKYTFENFFEAMKLIKKNIRKFSDKELFEENVKDDMFRYRCYCVGEYRGPNIWLYDNDGEGIRNYGHLRNVLNKWKSVYKNEKKPNPYENDKIWVVPADVHY